MWDPESVETNVSNMPEWDNADCVRIRKELVIQALTSPLNICLENIIKNSNKYRLVKPTPAQSSPYIICNTEEMMEHLGSDGMRFRKKTIARKCKNVNMIDCL
ncbi:hypothetical protein PIB30_086321 [Stylosanthes scabra]|uniref:Uncharacterized protein n=1 Tax=Stylosanthes scabra TaxID=79078 RepID=A0ABU6STU2_9FABA|nr:hypothetical protein [Stylosanthes scabra]